MPLILWWVVAGRWVLDGAYFWELLKSSFIVKKNKGKYPVGFELTFFLRGTEALASISSNLTIWVVCGTNTYAHASLLGFRGSLTEPVAKRLVGYNTYLHSVEGSWTTRFSASDETEGRWDISQLKFFWVFFLILVRRTEVGHQSVVLKSPCISEFW